MRSRRYRARKRFRPKHSRLKNTLGNRFFWIGLASCAAFAGAAYGVFFTDFLRITRVEIRGNEKISTESLLQVANEHIPQTLAFFEVNNFFLADSSALAQKIQAEFPEIESVTVHKTLPDKVRVIVKERQGVAVWCQEASSFHNCFKLDKHGVVFEEKTPESEVVVFGQNAAFSRGDQVIDPDLLEKAIHIQQAFGTVALFQQVGLRVSSLRVVSTERMNAGVSEGWEMYFNPAERLDWQIQKAKVVLEQEIPFQKRPFLEYIDLRFLDQAYIKYRD